MFLDVRTKKTIDEGIQLREEHGESIFILYAPGNGTMYTVLIQKLDACSPTLKDRMGLGIDGGGWVVTHMGGVPMMSMIVIDNQGGLLHPEYVQEKLKVSLADSVVLAELIGHVVGREYIPSEEYLQEENPPDDPMSEDPDTSAPQRAIPCCSHDYNLDGNCDRHPEAPLR